MNASIPTNRPRPRSKLWLLVAVPMVIVITLMFLLILPIVLSASLVHGRRQRKRIHQFFESHENGTILLVWHDRRGWHDFCLNNLLPVVPDGIEPIKNTHRTFGELDLQDWYEMERKAGSKGTKRPYLLRIDEGSMTVTSLNQPLQPFKRCARKSRKIQSQVACVVKQAIYDMVKSTPASGKHA